MPEGKHLADALEGLFVRPDHGLFTPFTVATDGLTASQAIAVPAERFNSIWAVVNHVRFWQEYTLKRLQGLRVNRQELGAENGWPLPDAAADESAWRIARERTVVSNKELATFVANLNDEEIGQAIEVGRASRYQVIQGIIAHNSYHTCEIISIRHMLGLWLERT